MGSRTREARRRIIATSNIRRMGILDPVKHDRPRTQKANPPLPPSKDSPYRIEHSIGHIHHEALPKQRNGLSGSGARGYLGTHQSLREIRSRTRLPLLHLRHLVDQTKHHARHCRSGTHHSFAGAHPRPAERPSKGRERTESRPGPTSHNSGSHGANRIYLGPNRLSQSGVSTIRLDGTGTHFHQGEGIRCRCRRRWCRFAYHW
mmetsp:Transcript_50175/g.103263  ORF Transcript_50175/g.103263 Transcript_50175/m.103263 type:complete len:204 (+) Transcript_50175:456-1067(+)